MVNNLAIHNNSKGTRFSSSPPNLNNTIRGFNDTEVYRNFTGPRTIVQLLATAAGSSGEILSIHPPANHSEFDLRFDGPYIRCNKPNASAVVLIDDLLSQRMDTLQGSLKEITSSYYSFVPGFEVLPDGTRKVVALDKPRPQMPVNATNELFITFLRATKDEIGNVTSVERHYSACRLFNVTFDITLQFDRGIQSIRNNSITFHGNDPVPYGDPHPTGMGAQAYGSVFWAIADGIVGSMSLSLDTATETKLGFIDTRLSHTALLGSDDLDYFFWLNQRNIYPIDTNYLLGKQRLQDKALARNRTLDILLEELSFNVTVSLLHNTELT